MSDGFQFFDIIFFALIAIFVILRLRAVLGRRTGQERQRPADMFSRHEEQHDDSGRVVHLPERKGSRRHDLDEPFEQTAEAIDALEEENDNQDEVTPERTEAKRRAPDTTKTVLSKIRAADSFFSERQFMEGARMAFEMIVEAFAKGDTPVLRPLLGDDVYDQFAAVIRDRLATKRTHETTIVAVEKAELVGAEMRGSTARLTVKFVSQQINLARDENDEIVEGDPGKIERVTDIWTFARNTRASDPNWALVETRAPVE